MSVPLEYLGRFSSTVAMAALQGPLVPNAEVDRYKPVRFVCFHCGCLAEELCLGVPIAIRPARDGKLQVIVRDHVALKCLQR